MATDNNHNDTDQNSQHQNDIHPTDREVQNNRDYWRANLKLGAILLSIWFLVSFGFGILLVEQLNQIQFFGFKLGFWWAQQGSIYVFIVLIFVYARWMDQVDRRYHGD